MEFILNPLDNSKITIKANPSPVTGGLVFGQLNILKTILTNIIIGQSFTAMGNSDVFIGNVDGYSYLNCTNNYNLQPDN